MQNLPSKEIILALHRKYAPSPEAFNLVYTHCQIIWEIASQLIERNDLEVDRDVVYTGALLHDIGVYELFVGGVIKGGYIRHGIIGDALLAAEGISPVLSHIASHHTGVGLTRKEIIRDLLPLPRVDFLAETPEERLIMYADKFHSKTVPPQFNSAAWYADDIERHGSAKKRAFLEMVGQYGEPDLTSLAAKYGFKIR